MAIIDAGLRIMEARVDEEKRLHNFPHKGTRGRLQRTAQGVMKGNKTSIIHGRYALVSDLHQLALDVDSPTPRALAPLGPINHKQGEIVRGAMLDLTTGLSEGEEKVQAIHDSGSSKQWGKCEHVGRSRRLLV